MKIRFLVVGAIVALSVGAAKAENEKIYPMAGTWKSGCYSAQEYGFPKSIVAVQYVDEYVPAEGNAGTFTEHINLYEDAECTKAAVIDEESGIKTVVTGKYDMSPPFKDGMIVMTQTTTAYSPYPDKSDTSYQIVQFVDDTHYKFGQSSWNDPSKASRDLVYMATKQ